MTDDNSPVVFITGASSGIGYETALAFAQAGYRVAGTARDKTRLADLQSAISGELLPLSVDVQDAAAVQQAVADIEAHFGRLDVVVANAGIGHRGSIVDSEWEHVETLLRTNIDGILHTIRAAVPAIRRSSRGGQVVFISSVTYNMTVPYAGYYAASKAFISSIAHSLRLELEDDGIGVTDMIVGRTATSFNENRLGGKRPGGSLPSMTPDKVAAAVVRAADSNPRTVFMRLFDRLTVWANIFFPERVGRVAKKQYQSPTD